MLLGAAVAPLLIKAGAGGLHWAGRMRVPAGGLKQQQPDGSSLDTPVSLPAWETGRLEQDAGTTHMRGMRMRTLVLSKKARTRPRDTKANLACFSGDCLSLVLQNRTLACFTDAVPHRRSISHLPLVGCMPRTSCTV